MDKMKKNVSNSMTLMHVDKISISKWKNRGNYKIKYITVVDDVGNEFEITCFA